LLIQLKLQLLDLLHLRGLPVLDVLQLLPWCRVV